MALRFARSGRKAMGQGSENPRLISYWPGSLNASLLNRAPATGDYDEARLSRAILL